MDLDDVELEAQLRETLHRAAEPVHGEGLFKETIRSEAARRQAARTRARWTGRLVLAGAAVAAAIALFVLIKPDQDKVDTDGGTGPVATEPEVTTTVDPDVADPRTGTIDDPSATTTTPTSDATTTTEPTTTTPSTAPALPDFPPEAPLAHGQPTWGVYLATTPEGQVDAPAFQAALQAIADAGYAEGYGSLGCDQGAVEAIGGDSSTLSASAYFATEAIANQAKAAFEARGQQVLGVVNVTTYCLD